MSLFNKALVNQEILQYMNCSLTGLEDGLVGCWDFEEEEGDVAYDLSPNGNNGTINGAIYSDETPEELCQVVLCLDSDEINVTFDVCGCTDESACNYNSEANEDDGLVNI